MSLQVTSTGFEFALAATFRVGSDRPRLAAGRNNPHFKEVQVIQTGAIVLYKNRPAVVAYAGDRLEISTRDGETLKVREKDVLFLHPGPVSRLPAPRQGGDFETARQMLEGQTADLGTVCDLVFGERAPDTALSCVEAAMDGSLFRLEGAALVALTVEERDREAERRSRKASESAEREAFVARARRGTRASGDERFLGELESLAYGKAAKSKLAADIGISETAEAAHAFLTRIGHWPKACNPWPIRSGLPLKAPIVELGPDDDSGRVDLTDFVSYAIDNAWSHDPDDAIAFHDGAVWIHVADPSSVVTPGTQADREASDRSGTLYLPEGTVPMLPEDAVARFGLGLSETSRALSFRVELDELGGIRAVDIVPSVVRVERRTYESAEELISGPLAALDEVAARRTKLRAEAGAVDIDIPEVRVWVDSGEPRIEPTPRPRPAAIVRELMVLGGEAAARWAFERRVPFPYYSQEAPQSQEKLPPGLAGEFAKRRLMKAGMAGTQPSAHRGLGVTFYAQATSPLRRYGDLLAHQQIRAALTGRQPLADDEVSERIGRALAALALNRQAERSSESHWTLVWLANNLNKPLEGVVVGSGGGFASVFVPSLGLETRIKAPDATLNATVCLVCTGVDIPKLDARWALAGC